MDKEKAYDNLRTDFMGMKLNNPFLLASSPVTATGEMIERAFDSGWGGAVIKTIHPDEQVNEDATPRFAALKSKNGEIVGFENCEMLSKKPVAYWLNEIRRLKQAFPDRILIGSIMASGKEEWQSLAKGVAEAGADALELNFSCPNGVPELGLGTTIGKNQKMVETITSWVKEAASVPVLVKLTPGVSEIAEIGNAAKRGGADALTAINTVQCITGVDLDTFVPLPAIHGKSVIGGYSGTAVKPIGLRAVAELSGCKLPVCGVGGIADWESAAEYIVLGASCVQLCTAVMLNGYSIIDRLLQGLSTYAKRCGVNSLGELVGRALPNLQTHAGLNKKDRITVTADPEKCIGCGMCVRSCRDGGYQALSMSEAGKVKVDPEKCDGCGLCLNICRQKVFCFT